MSREIKVLDNIKFRRKSIFDLLRLYKMMLAWLEFNGFKNKEDRYMENTIPGYGKNVEFYWTATKEVSDYFNYRIKLSALITGINKVEVEQKGKKLKLDNSYTEFRMTASLIIDPNDKYGKGIGKIFKPFYERFVIRNRIEEYKDDIYAKGYTFHDEIKNFLGLYS